MLCITLTNTIGAVPLKMNDRFTATRIYFSDNDIETFPNRLVFAIPRDRIDAFFEEIGQGENWLEEEHGKLVGDFSYAIVPFTIRVGEEVHKNFKENAEKIRVPAFDFQGTRPTVFIKHKEVPQICVACPRQAELKGKPCPDFVPDTLSCLNTALFALAQADAIYLNERSELVYAAAPVENA